MLVEISYCHHCYLAQLVIQPVQSFFVLLLGSTENKKILYALAATKTKDISTRIGYANLEKV